MTLCDLSSCLFTARPLGTSAVLVALPYRPVMGPEARCILHGLYLVLVSIWDSTGDMSRMHLGLTPS
jgi:hypothetical protein